MPDWTVEGALNEVRDTLDQSTPLEITPETQDEVRRLLCPSFQERHNEGSDWNREKLKVLSLVKFMGGYATVLTLADWADDMRRGRPRHLPTEVEQEDVVTALYFVAKEICVEVLAGYCGNLPISRPPSGRKLETLRALAGASAKDA